jgi:hypothetical protein
LQGFREIGIREFSDVFRDDSINDALARAFDVHRGLERRADTGDDDLANLLRRTLRLLRENRSE